MSELVNGFDASIVDEKASKVGPAGIDIAYQRLGNPDAPVVLLIMGIAAQSIAWPDAFCHALVDRGLQLIRFDNRDVGLSTHLTEAPPPDLPAALAGDLSSVSYTLSDMAADAVGLLDVLGFEKAHVVGASLGSAMAQTMAIEHPDRVRSHLNDVDNGQQVRRAALAGRAPRSVRRPTRSHPRRSHSANPPGFPRRRLAGISE
jgi:pimeloyl-ACP methyl ester carboxylesterase